MDLYQLYDKDYLAQIFNNEQSLQQAIIDTRGFVLKKLKDNHMMPNVDFLIKYLNVFSVQFIHDNYELNKNQINALSSFLREKGTLVLSPEEIQEYLQLGKKIPKNSSLTVEQINLYYDSLKEKYEEDYGYLRTLLENSSQKFSMDNLFNIRHDILENHFFILEYHKQHLEEPRFKQLYKETLLKRIDDNDRVSIDNFNHYYFEPSEKPLLEKILLIESKRNYDHSYDKYKNLKGFTELIDRFEFFEKYDPQNLMIFSEKEVENNISYFQDTIIKNHGHFHSYECMRELFRFKTTNEQFFHIVNQDFIENILENVVASNKHHDNIIEIFFRSLEDEKKPLDKAIHIAHIVSSMYVDNKVLSNGLTMQEICSPTSIVLMFEAISRFHKPPQYTQLAEEKIADIKDNIQSLYDNILPKYLNNSSYKEISNHMRELFSERLFDYTKNFFTQNVNVNNYAILLHLTYQSLSLNLYEAADKEHEKNLLSLLTDMHQSLVNTKDDNIIASIHDLTDYYHLMLKRDNKRKKLDESLLNIIKKTPNKTYDFTKQSDNNYLIYHGKNLSEIPHSSLQNIFNVRPDVTQYVLENNLVIPDHIVSLCLYSSNDNLTNFIKQYAKIHRKNIEQNESLLSMFLSSKKQKEVFPLTSNKVYHVIYEKLLEVINIHLHFEKQCKKLNKLYPSIDFPYSRDDDDVSEYDSNIELAKQRVALINNSSVIPDNILEDEAVSLFLDYRDKIELLEKEINSIKDSLPYSFNCEKIQDILHKEDFDSIHLLNDYRLNYDTSYVYQYINSLNFSNLDRLLDNKSFRKLLDDKISYDRTTSIQFSDFTDEANRHIALKLFTYQKEETESEKYNFLFFFKEQNRNFIKQFAIDYFPVEIFYDDNLLPINPNKIYSKNRLVVQPYSNEEIYQAFMNAENSRGFFSKGGSSTEFRSSFKELFFPELSDEEEKTMPSLERQKKYLDFLSFVKDKNNILYTLLSNHNIFFDNLDRKEYDWGKNAKYVGRDHVINDYFYKTFDLDSVLDGCKQVLDMLKGSRTSEQYINYPLANYVITSFIHNTYYDYYGDNYQSEYGSVINEEDTLKIMQFLYKNAPGHFVERYVIGKAHKPNEFFQEHIEHFCNLNDVNHFMFPIDFTLPDNLNLSNDHVGKRLEDYTKSIIEFSIDNSKAEIIEYMDYSIKQFYFAKRELKNRLIDHLYHDVSSKFIEGIALDSDILKLVEKGHLKMQLEKNLLEDNSNKSARRKI